MEQLKDPVTRANNMDDLETLDVRIFNYTFADFPYTFFIGRKIIEKDIGKNFKHCCPIDIMPDTYHHYLRVY